jgi:sugar phosphate isomerase/epimerase
MFAFSTCWNSHRHTDGRAMLLEIRELGYENIELSHGCRLSLFDGIQQAVAAKEVRIVSVHNFCPLPVGVDGPAPDYYLPSARKDWERQTYLRHTLRTLEFAAGLGAQAVVLHLGLVPMRHYTLRLVELHQAGRAATPKFERIKTRALAKRARRQPKYFEAVLTTLEALVPRAKERGLRLGLETRFGLEEIPDADEIEQLIRRFGPEVMGYWHDVGHAQIKENIGLVTQEAMLERFRGRTIGMHLQDFTPPLHDHQPPGHGTFDFRRLAPFLTPGMILVWELHPEWVPEQITNHCRQAEALLQGTKHA